MISQCGSGNWVRIMLGRKNHNEIPKGGKQMGREIRLIKGKGNCGRTKWLLELIIVEVLERLLDHIPT